MSDGETIDPGTITVSRNAEANRYEAHVDGDFAGVVEYSEEGSKIHLTHTEVFEQYRGSATANTLAGQALADAAERGLTIIPQCPYIARYLERHEVPGASVEAPQN